MAIPLSLWRRRYDDDTRVPRIISRCRESRSQTDEGYPSLKKEKVKFSKSASSIELSLGTSRTSIARSPKAPAAEINPFSVLGEKAFTPSSDPLEAKRRSIRGRKPEDPTYLVGTTRTSPLPRLQGVMSSPPNPEKKEEGKATPSDADIPDSIARALLDALQEKRTGNNIPPTMILIARVRASQLQQCLGNGERTIRRYHSSDPGTLYLGQEPSGLTNLTRKVSTVTHTYVRVCLELTEYRCTCTDKQQ